MQTNMPQVKQTLAVLNNVSALHILVTALIRRDRHEPGLGVFSGWAGSGKTYAAIYTQNKTGAIRLEVGESWSRKTFLQRLLIELGEDTKGTISDLAERAAIALGDDPDRPLLIDEADKLIDRGMIEIVRELHDATGVPVVLIGEEKLPHKLQQWERAHSRVLRWELAQPCDADDTRALAEMFCENIAVSDSLLEELRKQSTGRARRIVVNLSRIREVCFRLDLSEIDLATFEQNVSGGWYTSTPPRRGSA
ncbi:AAA family ATPase [Amorphus sp. MBR-141]